MLQQTIKECITFEGVGLHSGQQIQLKLCPAEANTGYLIKRVDLDGIPTIPALAEYVVSTDHSTVLEKGGVRVGTGEHLLSALYAMGVDNCIIEVNNEEVPILDGSSFPFIEAIQKVGLEEQTQEREYFYIKRRMIVEDPERGSTIEFIPTNEDLTMDVHIDFQSPVLGNQFASIRDFDRFAEEMASARTFVFVREILPLLQAGLIKGGALSNALVLNDEPLDESTRKTLSEALGKPVDEVDQIGAINGRTDISNEPARHKLVDLLGDIALSGRRIRGHIIATKPGHSINTKAAQAIRKQIRTIECQPPIYDPNQEPVMDVLKIRSLLPHRYPFLLVDKIIDVGNDTIVGVKNVTGDESFFQGHFPSEPVMPGVLIVEAMAQTGGLLVLNTISDESSNYSTYFLKIDNVKFRHKVVPGDTLVFRLKMMSEIRRGIANMRGLTFVGDKLVCEAEFTAQIVKSK